MVSVRGSVRGAGGRGGIVMQTEEFLDIEATVRALREFITARADDPCFKQTTQQKFSRWTISLDTILGQITAVDNEVIRMIEKDIGFRFKNRNLVVIALMQPSVKNLFQKILTEFGGDTGTDLNFLIKAPEIAESLAWAGDSAIRYAILEKIWNIRDSPENLHNQRVSLETNENLADRFDQWKIFKHRIHLDQTVPEGTTMKKRTGTLIEAIFGIIYIEEGMNGVTKAIPHIWKEESVTLKKGIL